VIYSAPRFLPAGDAALSIELADEISEAASALVARLDAALNARPPAGLIETVPTYRAVLIFFDPLRLDPAELRLRALDALAAAGGPLDRAPRRWEVPVVYGGEHGPDLEAVARRAGLEPARVVALHSGVEYRVYMIGFMPGFPYLGDVPAEIATPRLATPRTRVPAGSVAIAARQTCIYPNASPGGWNLLGRTAFRLFDLDREPPCTLEVGDRIRFYPVESLALP
jgi:KipI family sensor histidine kinase inhibitor